MIWCIITFALSRSTLFGESVDFPKCPKCNVPNLYWWHSAVSSRWKSPFQTKVTIMSIAIRPLIIDRIFCLSSHDLSQMEISRISGVSYLKVLCSVCESISLSQGLCGHQSKMTTSKEDPVLLRIIKKKVFTQLPGSGCSLQGELDGVSLSSLSKDV